LNIRRIAGRRISTSAHARPTVYAITIAQPPEYNSAKTSGISPSDIECELRRKCTCTTRCSATAKATMSPHNGSRIEDGEGRSEPTPASVSSAEAPAIIAALSSQMLSSPRPSAGMIVPRRRAALGPSSLSISVMTYRQLAESGCAYKPPPVLSAPGGPGSSLPELVESEPLSSPAVVVSVA
jgi:hypothetical protein